VIRSGTALATRNAEDFRETGIDVIDPWHQNCHRSQNVIGNLTATARVSAVLRERRLDADKSKCRPDLGTLCAQEPVGQDRWSASGGPPGRAGGRWTSNACWM
jgi:hypothetical protein